MARADYHQFTLTCDSMPLEWDGRSENGLAVVGEHGGVAIQTSVASGLVRYAWATHSSRPAVEDPWDDVVEVTIATETGEIHVEGWAGATHDETNLATEGPGTYRLRVSARDRGSEWDQNVEVAKEQFRFDIWPTSI